MALYDAIEKEEATTQPVANAELRKKLVGLIFQATGIEIDQINDETVEEQQMLQEMGVDSLAALRLQSMLKTEV